MATLNSNQNFTNSQASQGHYVKLDPSLIPELSSAPQGAYAILTYPVVQPDIVADNLSSINVDNAELEANTAFPNNVFNSQIDSISNVTAVQITSNAHPGWMTITVDDGDAVFIGNSGVTVNNGSKLNATVPSITVSSDDLSDWYVVGETGVEKIYIAGGYIL